MENSHSASPWQTLILQSFLSLYQISAKNTTSRDYFQGYDFVFEFSEAVLYVLVNEVIAEVSQYDIDASQVRVWRKDVVNQLMKRHAQVSLKSRTCGISFLIALCSATMKQEHLCPKHKLNY